MERENGDEKGNIFMKLSRWLRGLRSKSVAKVDEMGMQTKKMWSDDPRRLTHSLKVGFTLALVQFLYYSPPLYNTFGVSAMWAVTTVVVVFEFSVGATLGKGLNRGLATVVSGALGLGAHHLASLSGRTGEPILTGLFVFLQAAMLTFVRFFPKVKARYDYGVIIFILTFCLISISGLRTEEIVKLAGERVWTILIGASTCVIVSVFISPVWAGQDLHKAVAHNIHKLGTFLEEGIMDECSTTSEILNSVLVDSKCSEETLANFAMWEPGHGKFMYRHPWKQYLKIGKLTRKCACMLQAINDHLSAKTQAPKEIHGIIHEALSNMCSESGKALKELAWTIETLNKPSTSNSNITNLKIMSKKMKLLLNTCFLKEYDNVNLLRIIPVVALLIHTIDIVENIDDAVNELSLLAKFKCKETINGVGVLGNIPSVGIRIGGVDTVRVQQILEV